MNQLTMPEQTKSEEVLEIEKDLKSANALEALKSSEGGVILANGLAEDIVSNIETLMNGARTHTLQDFIALAIGTKEKLDLLKAISGASKNKNFLLSVLKEQIEKENA